jgi:ATP-binding protein involved in chromosome partitioning
MAITRAAVEDALRSIVDPDLNQDIVSLGFVKSVEISKGDVAIELELTTPACPVRDQFRSAAEQSVGAIPGVRSVHVTMSSRKSARPATATTSGLDSVDALIAIASGKGGVGKSTVAAAMAMELARQGYAVGLLDLDIYGPSIPTLFERHDVGLTGNEANMVVPDEFDGLKVMSFGFWLGTTPAIMRGPMVSNYIQQFLHQVDWGKLDYLFLDLPPGTGDVQITITQSVQLDGAVVITTPHALAAADVGKAIQMFDKVAVPVLGVVENMSYFEAPDTGVRYHVFGTGAAQRLGERFGCPLLGQLPISPQEFGGPTVSSPRSAELQTTVEAMIRNLGRSRAGTLTPEVTHDGATLRLTWPDGTTAEVDHKSLRASCQCAVCVDEFSGEPVLDPSTIPDDIHPLQVAPVGNYALSIEWSDGHTTGFFPYNRIRELAARR